MRFLMLVYWVTGEDLWRTFQYQKLMKVFLFSQYNFPSVTPSFGGTKRVTESTTFSKTRTDKTYTQDSSAIAVSLVF